MTVPHSNTVPYSEIRKRQRSSALAMAEVPTEHYVSLPLPTQRWGDPAYATFAAPAVRLRGQPPRQGPPDRWWLVSPNGGRLLLYSQQQILSFAPETTWSEITLPPPAGGIAQLQHQLTTIDLLLDTLAPAFFSGTLPDAVSRQALHDVLMAYLPTPLLPQYHALTPDFFTWLAP